MNGDGKYRSARIHGATAVFFPRRFRRVRCPPPWLVRPQDIQSGTWAILGRQAWVYSFFMTGWARLCDKKQPSTRAHRLTAAMAIQVERTEFDEQLGYQYYVAFNSSGTFEENEVQERVPVEVAVSLCENGDLADVSFELPKVCRSEAALEFLKEAGNASYIEPRVYITMPELNGDVVAQAVGRLELDLAGRMIGLEIVWSPIAAEEGDEDKA